MLIRISKKIEKWAENYKIEFNSEKSKALLVRKRRTGNNRPIRIYMNYELLEQVKTLKYLGIIVDHKFTFDQQIENVTQKCTALLHQLVKSAKLQWGLGYRAIKTIYAK